MKRIGLVASLVALALAMLGAGSPASAQSVQGQVVATCGTNNQSPIPGTFSWLTIDQTGVLCANPSGGGGGGAVTAAAGSYATGWSPDFGTLVSPAAGSLLGLITTLNATAAAPLAAGTAIIGKVGIDQTTPGTTNAVQIIAGTTGAATAYGLQSAASTNSTSVKASAGVLYGMNLLNTTTTIYYLRMYDLAAGPTCSSATGFVRTWPIPPAAASGGAGGIAIHLPITGTQFSTGIAFCLTGGPTSTDNTNAATGVFINLDYK